MDVLLLTQAVPSAEHAGDSAPTDDAQLFDGDEPTSLSESASFMLTGRQRRQMRELMAFVRDHSAEELYAYTRRRITAGLAVAPLYRAVSRTLTESGTNLRLIRADKAQFKTKAPRVWSVAAQLCDRKTALQQKRRNGTTDEVGEIQWTQHVHDESPEVRKATQLLVKEQQAVQHVHLCNDKALALSKLAVKCDCAHRSDLHSDAVPDTEVDFENDVDADDVFQTVSQLQMRKATRLEFLRFCVEHITAELGAETGEIDCTGRSLSVVVAALQRLPVSEVESTVEQISNRRLQAASCDHTPIRVVNFVEALLTESSVFEKNCVFLNFIENFVFGTARFVFLRNEKPQKISLFFITLGNLVDKLHTLRRKRVYGKGALVWARHCVLQLLRFCAEFCVKQPEVAPTVLSGALVQLSVTKSGVSLALKQHADQADICLDESESEEMRSAFKRVKFALQLSVWRGGIAQSAKWFASLLQSQSQQSELLGPENRGEVDAFFDTVKQVASHVSTWSHLSPVFWQCALLLLDKCAPLGAFFVEHVPGDVGDLVDACVTRSHDVFVAYARALHCAMQTRTCRIARVTNVMDNLAPDRLFLFMHAIAPWLLREDSAKATIVSHLFERALMKEAEQHVGSVVALLFVARCTKDARLEKRLQSHISRILFFRRGDAACVVYTALEHFSNEDDLVVDALWQHFKFLQHNNNDNAEIGDLGGFPFALQRAFHWSDRGVSDAIRDDWGRFLSVCAQIPNEKTKKFTRLVLTELSQLRTDALVNAARLFCSHPDAKVALLRLKAVNFAFHNVFTAAMDASTFEHLELDNSLLDELSKKRSDVDETLGAVVDAFARKKRRRKPRKKKASDSGNENSDNDEKYAENDKANEKVAENEDDDDEEFEGQDDWPVQESGYGWRTALLSLRVAAHLLSLSLLEVPDFEAIELEERVKKLFLLSRAKSKLSPLQQLDNCLRDAALSPQFLLTDTPTDEVKTLQSLVHATRTTLRESLQQAQQLSKSADDENDDNKEEESSETLWQKIELCAEVLVFSYEKLRKYGHEPVVHDEHFGRELAFFYMQLKQCVAMKPESNTCTLLLRVLRLLTPPPEARSQRQKWKHETRVASTLEQLRKFMRLCGKNKRLQYQSNTTLVRELLRYLDYVVQDEGYDDRIQFLFDFSGSLLSAAKGGVPELKIAEYATQATVTHVCAVADEICASIRSMLRVGMYADAVQQLRLMLRVWRLDMLNLQPDAQYSALIATRFEALLKLSVQAARQLHKKRVAPSRAIVNFNGSMSKLYLYAKWAQKQHAKLLTEQSQHKTKRAVLHRLSVLDSRIGVLLHEYQIAAKRLSESWSEHEHGKAGESFRRYVRAPPPKRVDFFALRDGLRQRGDDKENESANESAEMRDDSEDHRQTDKEQERGHAENSNVKREPVFAGYEAPRMSDEEFRLRNMETQPMQSSQAAAHVPMQDDDAGNSDASQEE
ncbi:MAG: hypothetical protein MHM6MM_003552 [Cercozoa sp. M6MM]